MITRSFVTLGLLLILCCRQSHHHIFLFINTSPLSLASEEFIPHNEPASDTDKESPVVLNAEAGNGNADSHGSQNFKSDIVTESDNVSEEEEDQVVVKDVPVSVTVQNVNSRDSLKLEQTKSSNDQNAPVNSQTLPNDSKVRVEEQQIPKAIPDDKPSDELPSKSSENDLRKEKTVEGQDDEESIIFESNRSMENMEYEPTAAKVEIPVVIPSAPVVVPTPQQKDEEPIPSFMEWTQLQQQKLHESNLAQQAVTASAQANGQNGHKSQHNTHSQLNKSSLAGSQMSAADKSRKESTAKNFASPDCGAKVIQSNPESQNANGVLSSSHDEYMLNKCGIPIWFIVELCEPLKIEKVSLGNLELFSSSPKDIEIGISDRYPTREWSKLGPFTLPDVRAIHFINLPASNASTFGKFLKVNILSHYGTEHFCPLSIVRVNGISEYEVLESENTHPEDIDVAEKEESALFEEPVIDQNQQTSEGNVADKSVFGSAKDVVINIVKKAAEVLVKSDRRKDAQLLNVGDTAVGANCRSLVQCVPTYETQFHERVLSLLSCNFSNLLPFLSENSPWCGWDYCHALFSRHSIGLPWQPEGFYVSLFGGPSILHALCNYHRPLPKESCDTMFPKNVSASAGTNILGEGYVNESVKSMPSMSTETQEAKEVIKDNEPPSEDVKEKSGSKKQIPELSGDSKPPPLDDRHIHPAEEPSTIPASGTASNDVPLKVTPPPSSPQQQNSQHSQGKVEDTQSAESLQNQQNSNNQQQQQQQQVPPPPQAPGQQQQQKESVFVRLSNRIKTLERNQTITASYLEELSRRFKKQNEENHHVNEGTKAFMNESKLKFMQMENAYKFELRSLRRNTEEIRERLFNVQLQRSLLILLCFIQFVALLSMCIWIRRKFRNIQSQLPSVAEQIPSTRSNSLVPVSPVSKVPSHSSVSSSRQGTPLQASTLALRKRVNSDGSLGSSLNSIDKSKKIKKKKKKLPDLKPVSMKITGSPSPASAPVEYSHGKAESDFKFKYPAPISSTVEERVVLSSYKENLRPEVGQGTHADLIKYENPALPTTPPPSTNGSSGGITLLSTQVDSPFSMISSTSTNFFVESGVSTSSRFALLASPGPGASTKTASLKRSGSLTSLDSSSTSSYSYGVKTGSNNIINGHGDSQSQNSSASGKKRKNKGLKALMPKIFDR